MRGYAKYAFVFYFYQNEKLHNNSYKSRIEINLL